MFDTLYIGYQGGYEEEHFCKKGRLDFGRAPYQNTTYENFKISIQFQTEGLKKLLSKINSIFHYFLSDEKHVLVNPLMSIGWLKALVGARFEVFR